MYENCHLMLRSGDLNCDYHANPEFEIIFVKSGILTVFYENKSIELSSGEATSVLPFSIHKFEMKPDCEAMVFMFSNSYTEECCNDSSIENKFKVTPQTAIYIDSLLSKEIFDLIHSKSLFYAFIAGSPYTKIQNYSKSETLRSIVEWIYDKIDENITSDKVCSKFGIGKRTLVSLFKNRLNMSFGDFLNSIRTEQAKKLILKNEQSITDIAFSCGFGSVRTFNRIFQRFSGCTPSEFKKNYFIK